MYLLVTWRQGRLVVVVLAPDATAVVGVVVAGAAVAVVVDRPSSRVAGSAGNSPGLAGEASGGPLLEAVTEDLRAASGVGGRHLGPHQPGAIGAVVVPDAHPSQGDGGIRRRRDGPHLAVRGDIAGQFAVAGQEGGEEPGGRHRGFVLGWGVEPLARQLGHGRRRRHGHLGGQRSGHIAGGAAGYADLVGPGLQRLVATGARRGQHPGADGHRPVALAQLARLEGDGLGHVQSPGLHLPEIDLDRVEGLGGAGGVAGASLAEVGGDVELGESLGTDRGRTLGGLGRRGAGGGLAYEEAGQPGQRSNDHEYPQPYGDGAYTEQLQRRRHPGALGSGLVPVVAASPHRHTPTGTTRPTAQPPSPTTILTRATRTNPTTTVPSATPTAMAQPSRTRRRRGASGRSSASFRNAAGAITPAVR
jgi:hypothetical protein